MLIETGSFDNPENHHDGWFRVFTFKNAWEIWAGKKWLLIKW